MIWTDKLKLNKQLVKSLSEDGFVNPKEVQLKTLTRISGGQDLIVIAPEGSGKTSTCVLSALNKFRQGYEDAPRVLILVPVKEKVFELLDQFKKLNKNKTIKIVGLYAAPGMEAQLDALADGADIIIATPDRARAIYLKLALDLNKIQLLILDDADLIVKQGLQLPVAEIANSIPKFQHLVFTEVMHSRLENMIKPFMNDPVTIEIQLTAEKQLNTYEEVYYHIPNFRTKLNLLNLFMEDSELFQKVIILVNSGQTADKIYDTLKQSLKRETMLYQVQSENAVSVSSVNEFLTTGYRILIGVNDAVEAGDIDSIPFVIHFDLPEEKETYVNRAINHQPNTPSDKMLISFVTDLELSLISKIETETGAKIPKGELPNELRIETGTVKRSKKPIEIEAVVGAAFHEKKASNAKTTNYSSGTKAKMNKKKKHG